MPLSKKSEEMNEPKLFSHTIRPLVNSIPAEWDQERTKAYLGWTQQAAALCAGISPTLDAVFKARSQFIELT